MKIIPVLKKFIVSSWFLAGIPAILVILLLPSLGSKYSLIVDPVVKHGGQNKYIDLNSDSISEIVLINKASALFLIAILDIDFHYYDQWNLKDSLSFDISDIFFGNYDQDKFKEIYVFSHKQDSLFLNMNEVLQPSGTKLERVFITKIGYKNGEVISVLKPAGFYDVSEDGKEELYFSITTGFGQPRSLFYFDLANRKLGKSQFTGTIVQNPKMTDADGDGKPEIFGLLAASGNYRANIPFSDSSTWFMVFDDQLKFEFPSVEFPGFANSLEIESYEIGNNNRYIVSHFTKGADTSVLKSRIMIFSKEGIQIRYRLYSDFGFSKYTLLFVTKCNQRDKIFILEDKLIELDEKLEVVKTVSLPFQSHIYPYLVDINADGENEFLLYSDDEEKLAIYNTELDLLVELKFKTPSHVWRFSNYFSKIHKHKLYLGSGENGYFLNLKTNKYYYLFYLIYPTIYFLFFFFILFIKKVNTRQVEQKERIKQRLLTLQLQGIKSQLDPHFTFNALNSVASLIYLEEREKAYDYMNKFTQLLRRMLNDADQIYRSLGEELDFVTNYLELEKLRFNEKFNYEITIGDGLSQKEQVPKMVLQTFAENAVKHGLMTRTNGGLLKIKVEKENDYIKLTIEDNGIGRAKSAGKSTSTGKGLIITDEFYNILNQLHKKPIVHHITDLYNMAGDAAGTRVEVWVPIIIN